MRLLWMKASQKHIWNINKKDVTGQCKLISTHPIILIWLAEKTCAQNKTVYPIQEELDTLLLTKNISLLSI